MKGKQVSSYSASSIDICMSIKTFKAIDKGGTTKVDIKNDKNTCLLHRLKKGKKFTLVLPLVDIHAWDAVKKGRIVALVVKHFFAFNVLAVIEMNCLTNSIILKNNTINYELFMIIPKHCKNILYSDKLILGNRTLLPKFNR
jgi:hypothetical protein